VHGNWRSLEVDRRDLRTTRVVADDLDVTTPGQVLFEVSRFGFSANNVTYASLGDQLGYWNLFPAVGRWGRIPVWGYLRVVSSAVPGVEEGRRAFGLCPMSTHVLLRPGHLGAATFAEESSHRAGLSSVYNVYSWADTDTEPDALLVLRPLFWLSFMLDDYLAQGEPGTGVVVTSASSKAAIGLTWLLSRRGVPVTGLTSAGHAGFVADLGHYDQVLTYDEIQTRPPSGAILVDVAGNAALRERIDRRSGHRLAEIIVAGHTQHGAGPAAPQAGDDRTVSFSAPQRIRQRAADWGWPVLEQRFITALRGFAATASSWLQIERSYGLAGAAAVYRQVLDNTTPPATADVVDLTAQSLGRQQCVTSYAVTFPTCCGSSPPDALTRWLCRPPPVHGTRLPRRGWNQRSSWRSCGDKLLALLVSCAGGDVILTTNGPGPAGHRLGIARARVPD